MGLTPTYHGLEYLVNWDISIDDSNCAFYNLDFDIRNPSNRLGTFQGSLEIVLPENVPINLPEIKVEGIPFESYENFIKEDQRIITMYLKDIIQSSNSHEKISVSICFQLENIVKKFGFANVFLVIGQARCTGTSDHAHKVTYKIHLPLAKNRILLFITHILGYLELIFSGSDDPHKIYRIETNAENPHFDYRKGIIEYSTSESKSSIMVMYSTLLDSRRFILFLGALIGAIIIEVARFFIGYILTLLKK